MDTPSTQMNTRRDPEDLIWEKTQLEGEAMLCSFFISYEMQVKRKGLS